MQTNAYQTYLFACDMFGDVDINDPIALITYPFNVALQRISLPSLLAGVTALENFGRLTNHTLWASILLETG